MLAPSDMPPPRPRQRPRVVIEPWPQVSHRAREQRSDYDDYTWPEGQPRQSRRVRLTTILAAAAIAWALVAFGGSYVRAAFRPAPAPAAQPPAAVNLRGPVGAESAEAAR